MPTQTINFEVTFKDASYGIDGILYNPAEFKNSFLWGIPLVNNANGTTLSNSTIAEKLRIAQDFVQELLEIRLFKQYISEQHDFDLEHYSSWGYIKANFNISKILGLSGRLNEQTIINYPIEWLTIFKQKPSYIKSHNLYLIPNGAGTAVALNTLATMNNAWFNIYGTGRIPNYWFIEYITGFDEVPTTLMNVIGKYAAIQILPIIEQTISSGGRSSNSFGIASNSLSMDGLSQNASKINGGNIFQQRIKQYTDEVNNELRILKDVFVGFTFDVM